MKTERVVTINVHEGIGSFFVFGSTTFGEG